MILMREFVETHNNKVVVAQRCTCYQNLRICRQRVWEIWTFVCCCPKFQTDFVLHIQVLFYPSWNHVKIEDLNKVVRYSPWVSKVSLHAVISFVFLKIQKKWSSTAAVSLGYVHRCRFDGLGCMSAFLAVCTWLFEDMLRRYYVKTGGNAPDHA